MTNPRYPRPNLGFSLVELMVAVAVLAVLVAAAAPSFQEYFAKARLRGAADGLASQVALARANAMRNDRDVVVSVVGEDDVWCSGGRQFAPTGTVGLVGGAGSSTCDCSDDASVCIVAGQQSLVSSTDYSDVQLDSLTGSADLQFDRKVGMLTDLTSRTIALKSAKYPDRFALNVVISPLGHARICLPSGAAAFGGYKSC